MAVRTITLAPVAGFETGDVLAGPWCLGAGEGDAPLHPYPLLNRDRWQRLVDTVYDVYDETMDHLATWYDGHFQTDRGREYWHHVLGWFVRIHTDVVADRHAVVMDIHKSHPQARFLGLQPGDFGRPLDAKNFLELCRYSDLSNLQIMTQVALALELPVQLKSAPPDLIAKEGLGARMLADDRFVQSWPDRLWPFSARRGVVLYKTLMRRRVEMQLKLNAAVSISNFAVPPPQLPQVNAAMRAGLADSAPADGSLLSVNLRMLAQNMPVSLLEAWPASVARYAKTRAKPRAIVSGLGAYWTPHFAIWAAEARRHGTVYVGLQHGGAYGERDRSTFELQERASADIFVTWGWKEDDSTIPLPAARLAGIKRRKKPVIDGTILWVGTSDSRYVYQLGPRPVGPQFQPYFDSQRAFAHSLTPEVAASVLFRPYPGKFNWSRQPGLDGELPVQIDDFKTSFRDRIAQSRLIVVDHPGSTTLLEALAADCPVMCFGAPEIFDIRDSARPFYDALKVVGLFHDSAESAGQTANRIAHDVPGWWQEPERQAAVRAFMENFALRGRFLHNWGKFLRKAGRGILLSDRSG